MTRQTIFSPCRKYRYTLWREWPAPTPDLYYTPDPHLDYYPGKFDQYLMVIGLNPSTADETTDDPTIRKCIKYAKALGFSALCMTNLFAWRDTDPEKMKIEPFPVGGENDFWLYQIAKHAGMVLAAWGNHGDHQGRAHCVTTSVLKGHKLHCLAINSATGQPKHPLYCKDSQQPMPFKL